MRTLNILLKKKEALSPEDLTLPWQPLYELFKKIYTDSSTKLGMYRYVPSLSSALENLVLLARFYFPVEATGEILDEGRPMLCPFDLAMTEHAIRFFEWFLPIALPPEKAHQGYKMWIDEFLEFWETCNNFQTWERIMMSLMARVAHHNIGYIDWEKQTPLMFTRFLRSMSLPVEYKQMNTLPKFSKADVSSMSVWIVSTLGGGSSTQIYLDKFMKSLESYYQPANMGWWISRLKDLLCKLAHNFFQRVHRERYKKPTWETPVPAEKKLTDKDITDFVECMKPALMTAMFSKWGFNDIGLAMKNMASLRPELIIPPIIEAMYQSVDSLTEPHKYTAAMHCTASVARPLLEGWKWYPEGPTHIIPLLYASLPGIDPNDVTKCFKTFYFISSFASCINFVDCSQAALYWNDLTPEEEIVCSATAQMEDFVVQLLDRCLCFIESSAFEATRLEQQQDSDKRNRLDSLTESAIASAVISILNQCSPNIFAVALQKLVTYVESHILETNVSGRYLATLCSVFGKVNPEKTLKSLVPYLCETILTIIGTEEIHKDELVDKELLYNLVILSELACCPKIVHYLPQIEKVLDKILYVPSKELYIPACNLLGHLFMSLSSVSIVDYSISSKGTSDDISQVLPIREWGKSGDVNNLNMEWNYPGDEELKEAQRLLIKYLIPELERINKHVSDETSLTRDELHRTLQTILEVFECDRFLPSITGKKRDMIHSFIEMADLKVSLGENGFITMPDGSNVKEAIARTIKCLQDKLMTNAEDDTKSLFYVIDIFEALIMNCNKSQKMFDAHWKNFQLSKKYLGTHLKGNKKHQRPVLIDRVKLQHIKRSFVSRLPLTELHCSIFHCLLTLSVSRYSEVRSKAQSKLINAMDSYPYSYKLVVPKLIENLHIDPLEEHERFKGSLYLVCGMKNNHCSFPILTKLDWEHLSTLWPVLVTMKPSEKPSVIRMIENIYEIVHKHFPTATISLEVPKTCVTVADQLWTTVPKPKIELPSTEEIERALDFSKQKNEDNKKHYLKLVTSLSKAVGDKNLHWRNHTLALSMLRDLVHNEISYPTDVVGSFLHSLINDALDLRKIAIRCTTFALKQMKRPHLKEDILTDSPEFMGSSGDKKVMFGDRADNAWLHFNSANKPKSEKDWDEMRYQHKLHIGYYSWPKVLHSYAPASKQPPLDRSYESLSESEKEVYDFFSSSANVDKLILFLSMEEKKGKDKFNGFHFSLFKSLFRNHGDQFLVNFKPHLERLVQDKHESSQRCVAEIIAGLVRGSKHWPYKKVEELENYLVPLIRQALNNMTEETVNDWGVCFATCSKNRDPNRQQWMFEVLIEDPLRNESSLIGCGRLYALLGALNQNVWRVPEISHRLLDYIRPHLMHSFQNVRDRIGSILATIFESDLRTSSDICRTTSPTVRDFVSYVLPQLNILCNFSPEDNSNYEAMEVDCDNEDENTEVEEAAIRLFKTVMRWVIGSLSRGKMSSLADYWQLLPLVCLMENDETDDELYQVCKHYLAALSQSLVPRHHMSSAVDAISKVSTSKSWSVRKTCLQFMQVFIFHNMATLASNDCWVSEIKTIVLSLLNDERIEVRETASQVLSGLIHCDFISVDAQQQLLTDFGKRCRTKVEKKAVTKNGWLAGRHAAVLGLCAFINASPYDVPQQVPAIFQQLGQHLNDPQPIPSTIRKTLGDFKRTHHDNWSQHKLKFTEEQLCVLTDLNVPPSYYA
ncbi:proteasome activator complex subunit 4 isoform X2 [Nilaparvata lugens]|nr:proteasome activator complex subunit 4 isoform X2 [Nilaparvata lugens]